jgi:hypothetical protein
MCTSNFVLNIGNISRNDKMEQSHFTVALDDSVQRIQAGQTNGGCQSFDIHISYF